MFFWATLEKGVPFFLNFAITIILARLVPPEAYGLVAMTAIVIAIGTVIQNVGLSSALIQREEITDDDATTVFIVNTALSAAFGGALVLTAPSVAAFYQQPQLVPIIWANAVVLFLGSLGIIQSAMLQRHYRFRTGFIVELSAVAFAGTLAIAGALAGWGVWALVAFALGQQGARSVLLWLLVGWIPRGQFRWSSFTGLWSYARHLLLASLYHNIATNLSSVIIGKFYGVGVLGLFARAQSLQMMPVGLVTMPFQRVAFPLYSRHQGDMAGLMVLMRSHTRALALIGAFVMAGLVTCASEIPTFLFGPQWGNTGPMLQILAMATIPVVLMPLHSEANKGIGKSRWFLWVEILKKTVLVTTIIIGAAFGLEGLLYALVTAAVSDYVLSAVSSVRFVGYTWQDQLADILPSLGTGLAAIALAFGIEQWVQPQEGGIALLSKGLLVTVIFVATVAALGRRVFPEAFAAVRTFVRRTVARHSFS